MHGYKLPLPLSYAGQEEASDWNKQRVDSWHHQLRFSTWRDMLFIGKRLCILIAPDRQASPFAFAAQASHVSECIHGGASAELINTIRYEDVI